MRIVAIVLVVVGVLALVYGGFTYTTETHQANIGPLDFSITEKGRGQRACLGGRRVHGRGGRAPAQEEGLIPQHERACMAAYMATQPSISLARCACHS